MSCQDERSLGTEYMWWEVSFSEVERQRRKLPMLLGRLWNMARSEHVKVMQLTKFWWDTNLKNVLAVAPEKWSGGALVPGVLALFLICGSLSESIEGRLYGSQEWHLGVPSRSGVCHGANPSGSQRPVGLCWSFCCGSVLCALSVTSLGL